MVNGAQPDKGFRDRVDRNRRHHPHFGVAPGGHHAAQHQAVDDRTQHADVVGFRLFDPPLCAEHPPEDVSAADNDAHADAHAVHGQDLIRNVLHPPKRDRIESEFPIARDGGAAQFKHNSPVSHYSGILRGADGNKVRDDQRERRVRSGDRGRIPAMAVSRGGTMGISGAPDPERRRAALSWMPYRFNIEPSRRVSTKFNSSRLASHGDSSYQPSAISRQLEARDERQLQTRTKIIIKSQIQHPRLPQIPCRRRGSCQRSAFSNQQSAKPGLRYGLATSIREGPGFCRGDRPVAPTNDVHWRRRSLPPLPW